jgi:hypothetical protein
MQILFQQKRDLEVTSPKASPTRRPRSKSDNCKAKRPMNAFMLFAKKFRLEYTHMFPGKDNRYVAGHQSRQTRVLTKQHERVPTLVGFPTFFSNLG